MSNLNIDVKEVLKKLTTIESINKKILEDFHRLRSSMESLETSWRDSQYDKVKGFINQGNAVLRMYEGSMDGYIETTRPKMVQLMKDYLEADTGNTLDSLNLDDLGLNLDQLSNEVLETMSNGIGELSLNEGKDRPGERVMDRPRTNNVHTVGTRPDGKPVVGGTSTHGGSMNIVGTRPDGKPVVGGTHTPKRGNTEEVERGMNTTGTVISSNLEIPKSTRPTYEELQKYENRHLHKALSSRNKELPRR